MNMQNLMAQAQRIQKDINNKKDEIDKTIFSGKSEWVELTFDGKKELKSFKITKEGDISSDDKEMLEDMILLAIKDAFKKIDEETEKKLGQYASMSGLF